MRKVSSAVYFFLGLLEALLSGVYFFLAGKDEEPKVLNLLTSVVVFLCGLMHMCMGMDACKAEKAERLAAEEAAFESEDF